VETRIGHALLPCAWPARELRGPAAL